MLVRGGDRVLERAPAVGAEALEAGELRLDRDARAAGGLDRGAAVTRYRLGGEASPLGRIGDERRLGPDRDRPKPGRVGVEAENDLAAALLYERREPISEVLRQEPLMLFFSALPALNFGTRLAAIWIRSPV